ncbi:carbohydrate ABC transporter permease [Nocardioides hwasunensis]|uniref:Sugar ABC transporter permease n=1 Tax=Nocardioides hwasunensis TaxID=397258 RepID=A0ABR8MH89_9ACTN|nr:sugar ABC transporter permease [Nocardioides hwasunensis]MBD3915425.1 sugar ABC transporter permease [Nocardioides hwasunensis]
MTAPTVAPAEVSPQGAAMTGSPGQARAAWGMLAPNLLLIGVFLAGPLAWAFAMAFQDKRSFGKGTWSGLDNLSRLFGDDVFWRALLNTAIFTAATVPVGVLLGLGLALLMNKALPGRGVFRTIVYLPIVVSSLVTSLVGLLLFDESVGIINGILRDLGLADVSWQSDGALAMTSVVVMTLWSRIGFSMVIYIAALQDVDPQVIEAAEVDGARAWQVTRRVVVPLLRPTTFFLVLVNLIWSFQVFDVVYVMTNGGPGYSTTMLVTYAYDEGFGPARNFGYGATVGVVLFVIIGALTLLQLRRNARAEA